MGKGDQALGGLGKAIDLAKFLYVQRVLGLTAPDEPHFDDESTVRFKALLAEAPSYMEFGSGGSTVLAGRLGKPTLSIESDRFFARAVRAKLPAGTPVRILDIDIGLTGPWGVPVPGTATPSRVARWRDYIEAPFRHTGSLPSFPAFALVDGRFRRACALATAQAARAAGAATTIMFDDYFPKGREHYHSVETHLGSPERVGRAAFFTIGSDGGAIPAAAIDEAIADYR